MPADLPPQPPGYHRPAELVGPHDVPVERAWVHPLTALQLLARDPAPQPAVRSVDVLLGTAPQTIRLTARHIGVGLFRLTANDPR